MQPAVILRHLCTLPPRRARAVRVLAVLAGLVLWLPIGALWLRPPLIDTYDVTIFHQAGRVFFRGGDPYGAEFAQWMAGDPTHSAYAYPPASFGVLLLMLPLPQPYAFVLWTTASFGWLLFLTPLLNGTLPRRLWLLPVAYYPSLYALSNAQWAPVLLGLLGASIYLFRTGKPRWAGFLVPFMVVKPTVGLGLGLFALVWCGHDRRWWLGCVIGGVVGYVLPFIVQQDWPVRWLDSVRRYAGPADQQYLVTLTTVWDGKLCAVIALGLVSWSVYTRRWRTLSCTLLLSAMLITPHRAHYDYSVLCVPFLFVQPRWRSLAMIGVAASWLFPATFIFLHWGSSLQLTMFLFLPALLACTLVAEPQERRGKEPTSSTTVDHDVGVYQRAAVDV